MSAQGLLVPDRHAALDRLREHGVSVVRPARAGTAWFGLGPERAGYLAATHEGVRRLGLERRRLDWAAAQGIAVPQIVADRPGLLVTRRVRADAPVGVELARAAVAVTRQIASASTTPDGLDESVSRRARRPWSLPLRLTRGLARGVPWPEFRRVRAEAAELPATVLAHGDFQDDNLLWDTEGGVLHVIDWDYADLLPEGTDLLNLWVHLPDDTTRDLVIREALSSVGDRAAFGVLAHWLALRHVAEVATGRPGADGAEAWRDRLTNARASVHRARALRADLGARP